MHQPPGHGLLIEAPSPTDYVAGDGKLAGEVIIPDGDWTPFIPAFEHQAPAFETNSCASHGTLNALEALYKFFYGEEMNLADRMVATGSGTDPNRGNTPQRVAQFVRDSWSVYDEEWSMKDARTVQEYYKPFPDLLYSKADIIRGDNRLGYEAVTNPTKLRLHEALTKGAVCMSVPAWAIDDNGLYYRPQSWNDNHWVWLVRIKPNGNYVIMDSYDPALKELRADFIPQVAYRYVLNEEITDQITLLIRAIKAWLAKFV
jgi:hypothetical protein